MSHGISSPWLRRLTVTTTHEIVARIVSQNSSEPGCEAQKLVTR